MSEADILQVVLEVGPDEKGRGAKMALYWDGDDRGLLEAEFDGAEVSTEISPADVLSDYERLVEQACQGDVQIIRNDQELARQLRLKLRKDHDRG